MMVLLQEQAQDPRGRGGRLSVVPIPPVEESLPSIFNDVMAANLNSMASSCHGCIVVLRDRQFSLGVPLSPHVSCFQVACWGCKLLQSARMLRRLATTVSAWSVEVASGCGQC